MNQYDADADPLETGLVPTQIAAASDGRDSIMDMPKEIAHRPQPVQGAYANVR